MNDTPAVERFFAVFSTVFRAFSLTHTKPLIFKEIMWMLATHKPYKYTAYSQLFHCVAFSSFWCVCSYTGLGVQISSNNRGTKRPTLNGLHLS